MTPERLKRIETLFYAALEQPAESRSAFLARACDGDEELRSEAAALLEADASRYDSNSLSRQVLNVATDSLFGYTIHGLVGKRVAQYEILSPLGAGGMGEVYLANDTRLNRKVAIKFLYPDSMSEPSANWRLLNEAQAAAALDHPCICTVYEVGEAEAGSFIVMQYVEGETLGARLKREPLELTEALRIAHQVIQALTVAHSQGVIHRDIKPQNILLTARGEVKVLDFGLAKRLPEQEYDIEMAGAVTPSGSGMVVGTTGYMSPEQAQGRNMDCRSDLFSFGVVLYEMLTRQKPFARETTIATMAAIIEEDPPALMQWNPDLAPDLNRMVLRLLAKSPDARLQTAAETQMELERLLGRVSGQAAASGDGGAPIKPRWRASTNRIMYAGVSALFVLALWLAAHLSSGPPPQLNYAQLTHFTDGATAPILSPDGRMLAFIRGGSPFLSRGQIWVKQLPDGQPMQLTKESLPISTPYFSPDGAHIAYTVTDPSRAAWDTWVVSIHGGPSRKLFSNATGLSWIGDGRILFSEIKSGMHMGMVTSSESRSDTRGVYFPVHERGMAHYSYLSPDRRWVLIVEMDHTASFRSCRLVPFDGSSKGDLVGPEGSCTAAAWSPDGKWMYFAVRIDGDSHLWRQRFPDGVPEQMTFGPTQESGIAVASDGRSIITAMGLRQGEIWIHEPNGDRAVSPEGDAASPKFNATARRIYYLLRRSPASAMRELWVTDLVSGKSTAVLTGFAINRYDISPDEKEVLVSATEEGKSVRWVAPLDGLREPAKVGIDGELPFFGPKGEIVFQAVEDHKNYLYKTSLDRSRREKISSRPISNIRSHSPDGQWAVVLAPNDEDASTSNLAIPVSGGPAVTVCAGACIVRWSPNGRFFQIAFDPTESPEKGETFVLPLPPGWMLPSLSTSGLRSAADVIHLPGVRRIPVPGITPGADPDTYAYVKTNLSQNLYRITVP